MSIFQKPPLGTPLKRDWHTDGLVGFWSMQEGAGLKIHDISGKNNHGTLIISNPSTDTSGWKHGLYGSTVLYNGSSNYTTIANDQFLNPSYITLSAWFKATQGAFNTNKPIIQKAFTSHSNPYYQYSLLVMDYGAYPKMVALYIAVGGTLYALSVINTNFDYVRWHHLAGTYDGNVMRLYLNGNLIGTSPSYVGVLNVYNTVINLGAYPNLPKNSTYCFDGMIDLMMIHNRALSAQEVWELYTRPCDMWLQNRTRRPIYQVSGTTYNVYPTDDILISDSLVKRDVYLNKNDPLAISDALAKENIKTPLADTVSLADVVSKSTAINLPRPIYRCWNEALQIWEDCTTPYL